MTQQHRSPNMLMPVRSRMTKSWRESLKNNHVTNQKQTSLIDDKECESMELGYFLRLAQF